MKKIIVALLIAGLYGGVQAQVSVKQAKVATKSKGWLDDYAKAQQEATTFKQPLFVFFTGSDWCGWCIKLKEEVLDTKEFERFAADNLILFEADFPRREQLSAKVRAQNEALAQQFGVRGYPTIFLLDASGKQLAKTGYKKGGAKAYVEMLKGMLEEAGYEVHTRASVKELTPYEKMKAERAAQEQNAGKQE